MNPTSPPRVRPVGISDYVRASAILAVFGCGLWLALRTAAGSPAAEALLAPVTALVALTGVVWLVMVVVRNLTILRGITRPEYFRDYTTHSPAEWVERPARTFNNLLQVPS